MGDLILGLMMLAVTGWFAWKTSRNFRRDVDAYYGPEAFEPQPREQTRPPERSTQ